MKTCTSWHKLIISTEAIFKYCMTSRERYVLLLFYTFFPAILFSI